MARIRLLVEALAFAVASLVVVGGMGLVVGVPLAVELAGLADPRPLFAFVVASPFALLGGYFWLKHRVVRPGVA